MNKTYDSVYQFIFYYLSYNFASLLKILEYVRFFLMLHILKNIKTLAAQTGKNKNVIK